MNHYYPNTTYTTAAFAPKALRRASPELVENNAERRREAAEHAEILINRLSANSARFAAIVVMCRY